MTVLFVHDDSRTSDVLSAALPSSDLTVRSIDGAAADEQTLRVECETASEVVYLSTGWDALAIEREAAQIDILIAALGGTGKRLLYISESTVIGDTKDSFGNEDSPRSSKAPHPWRADAERQVADAVSTGVHSIIVRPALIHGRGAGELVERLRANAAQSGESVYVGDGAAHVSTVHIDDVVTVIQAALRRAPQGTVYTAASHEVLSWRELAEALVLASDQPWTTKSESATEAAAIGLDAATMAISNVMRDDSARRRLRWQALGPPLASGNVIDPQPPTPPVRASASSA